MNLKDYQKGRDDGLALAAKLIIEGGEEALKEEIRARGVCGVHTNLTMKELDDAMAPIKQTVMETMLAMTLFTLHDEFGFGKQRLERFRSRFQDKANCLGLFCTWRDIIETLEEETGVKADIYDVDTLDKDIASLV